jgi:hypothetical protein
MRKGKSSINADAHNNRLHEAELVIKNLGRLQFQLSMCLTDALMQMIYFGRDGVV